MKNLLTSRNFLLLLIISLLVRFVIFFTYAPIGYADSGWYYKVANEIITLDFSKYDGARTPGYPIVMILGGLRWKGIWIIQLLMGVCISLIMYQIAYRLTHSSSFSFWTGMSYNLSAVFLFFESNILTETTCTLFLVLTLYLCLKLFDDPDKIKYYLLVSLTISLLSLTRPVFLYLYPLIFLFIFIEFLRGKIKFLISFKKLSHYLLPFLFLVIGYCLFNKITINYFGLSTLSGYTIIYHFLDYMPLAPDEYSSIRDIYLKHRKMQLEHPSYWNGGVIWPAAIEMRVVNNWTMAEMSNKLNSLSLWFIVHYPNLYLKSVSNSYFFFWYRPDFINYFDLEKIKFKGLRDAAKYYLDIELELWLVLNALYILFLFYIIYLYTIKKEYKWFKFFILLYIIVFVLSILQALMATPDNWRYSYPIKPIILLSLILCFRDIYYRYFGNKIEKI